jgi:HAD superfamily hydrolase (TIGR01509 family)
MECSGPRQTRAVIFDLDGCLVDSERLSIGAITDEMRAMGIPGATFESIRDRFLGVSMRVICAHVAERSGADCPQDFVARVEARLFEAYRTGLRRIKGVTALLDALEAAGVPAAIATGGSVRRMLRTLDYSGLAPRFQGRAYSADQVAEGKPAPDLFLHVADVLDVAPEDCVVLEDSPHGVVGARAAGMRVVGFTGGSHLAGMRDAHAALLRDAGADQVLDRMDGVFAALCPVAGASDT